MRWPGRQVPTVKAELVSSVSAWTGDNQHEKSGWDLGENFLSLILSEISPPGLAAGWSHGTATARV